MSDGWREGRGDAPLGEWDERSGPDEEGTAPESARSGGLRKLPWSKLSWLALAIACGVATSLVTSPQGLVAAFRSQPQKIVGVAEGDRQPEAGKVIKMEETAPNRLQFAQVRDVIAQQPENLGVETIDPVPRRQRRMWEQPPVGMVVTVPASQGRLLRFDEPIESVFIADPTIADVRVVSADVVYVYGRKIGLTNLMAVSAMPPGPSQNGQPAPADQKLTASVLLRIVTDPRPAQEGLQDINPMAADTVDIRLFGRRAVVTGRAANVDEAVASDSVAKTYSAPDQPPINTTTVDGATQINIRVRFAEVTRNDLQSLGIDWNLQVQNGSFQFGLVKQTGGRLTSSNPAAYTGTLNPNKAFGIGNGNFNLDVLIEALKRNGMLHILAEPNLTAVSGETASFLAGGEVPIPVPQGGNSDAVTIQYKPFGVSLLFTPTMIRPNRIGLKVKPEVSAIAANNNFAVAGFNIPSFTVRRAETVVEVASGQTFAMAGLFQRNLSRSIEKFPFLGDVPVLGQLFTSERYQRDETELVILITPYMVEPVRDQQLLTPLDREANAPWAAQTVDATAKGYSYDVPPEKDKGFTKTKNPGSGFNFK
jgi:pilus assembly protein CpaC